MAVIEEFISRYRKEYDFYDQAARMVAQLLERRLQAAGVRAMVTFRAKAFGKLESKVRDRARRKGYQTVDDIYTDIPDLAGARVALYFPGQREQVELLINETFVVQHMKVFPRSSRMGARPGTTSDSQDTRQRITGCGFARARWWFRRSVTPKRLWKFKWRQS